MSQRIVNFSAGPAAIPEPVLLEAQQDLFNYKGAGLSIMEMSHRSKEYDAVHQAAISYLTDYSIFPQTIMFYFYKVVHHNNLLCSL